MGDKEILETYLNSASKNTSEIDLFPHGTKSLLTIAIIDYLVLILKGCMLYCVNQMRFDFYCAFSELLNSLQAHHFSFTNNMTYDTQCIQHQKSLGSVV